MDYRGPRRHHVRDALIDRGQTESHTATPRAPGQIDELWILDVGGVLVVIDTASYADTPAEHVEELRAIVESAVFEAP